MFRTRLRSIAMIVLVLCVQHPGYAQIEAITRPSKDLSLGFTAPGRVVRVLVKPGDTVKQGQIIASLDDRQARAQVDLLAIRAESDLEVKIAEAEWKLAQNEESRVRDAFSADAAGEFEVERLALQTERARVRMLLAQRKQAEATQQLAQAELLLDQMSLRSPVAGVVETVAIEPGEMVQQAQPVIRIVVSDPLLVEAAVPTKIASTLQRSMTLLVHLDLPDVQPERTGSVIFIAAVADPASDTRVVRVELDNPNRTIPAGIVARLALPPGTR